MPDIFVADKEEKEKAETLEHKTSSPNKSKSPIKYPKTEKDKNKLPGHTHNPLAAFCYFPDHVKFVNQDPKERVVLMLRKHPITNIRWILLAIVLLITPAFFTASNFF